MRRPLIGLPGRRKAVGQVDGFPSSLGELHLDLYFADYARCVYSAGGMPVHLPMDADPADWVHHLDGLVLPGGADVDPDRYGHANTASDVDGTRDALEFALFDAALADGIPVLGVCRGLQLINVHHGGTLTQDVPAHARYDLPPAAVSHDVITHEGSVLREIYGERVAVNSLHHQVVDELGTDLRVTARADDGTVEGLEAVGLPVVAVQWHPEMMSNDDPGFHWVVTAARERA